MKQLLLIISLCFVASTYAQNCEDISPYKKGMYLEYTNYNKKGKVKSVEKHDITNVGNQGDIFVIDISSTYEDAKNKDTAHNYQLQCEDGNFYIDMSNYMAHQNGDQQGSLEVKATGDFLQFPDNMQAGDILEDGNIDISIGGDDAALVTANMLISNRNVKESVSLTIPAGTFDTYKMSFDYLFTIGFIKIRGKGVEWYVKGIGIVKSESYSKKGKLRWTRELTKIEGQ